MSFRTLAHLRDQEFLKEAFRKLKHGAAVGVDEITWAEYGRDLDVNVGRSSAVRAGRG